MRILVVCQFYYPENFVISDICRELKRRGHDVTVVTGKPNYGFDHILKEYKKVKYEVIDGVRVFRLHLFARKRNRLSIILNYLSFYFSSRRFLKHFKEEYDVVYSQSLSPIISVSGANIYKRKYHINHVLHCLDLWPISPVITHAIRENGLFYKILYKWSKSIYSKCDKILLSSPSFKDYFYDVLKLENKYYKYIPQPPLFSESINEEANIEYGKGFHILYCGNIGTIQGIELIPQAMKEVIKKYDDVYFHIIGMGTNKIKLEEEIKRLGMAKNVIFHGPIPMKKARLYYPNIDALYVSLLPSGVVGNTIPSKLISYLTYKKPIIGVIGGDGKQVLEETKGALICKPNINDIANSIIKMKEMDFLAKEKMGENNYYYYKSHFALDKIVDQIEQELLVKKV